MKRWKKVLIAFGAVFGLVILVGVAAFVYDTFRYANPQMAFNSRGGMVMETASPSFFGGDMAMEESLIATKQLSREAMPSSIIDNGYADDGRVEADSVERHIIQTGDLSLIVESVQDSITEIKTLTGELEGFIAESNIREHDDQSFSGWIRIRVPSESFDKALEQVKDLAVRVENENTRADDVTDQVVDIETRLLNLEAQEQQYREIMKKAFTVEDILQVTQQLNSVRQQIERMQAQLKSLADRVSFSTLSINLVDEGDVEVFGIYWRPLFEVKQAFRNALENLTGSIDSIVVILFHIPVVVLWAAVFVLILWTGWRLGKWCWKKWWK